MVRLSKQKQEKLEHIMSLVEHLGIDRVLVKLRQTKMMSKDILDDMREWETDYEKRVALLGFLVSPEGKQAFGALYELAKVREEQLKLQEEQEKLRQEQMAQQGDRRAQGAKGQQGNMKNKLRQQMAKRRVSQPTTSQKNNVAKPSGSGAVADEGPVMSLQVTAVAKPEKKPPTPPEVKQPSPSTSGNDNTKKHHHHHHQEASPSPVAHSENKRPEKLTIDKETKEATNTEKAPTPPKATKPKPESPIEKKPKIDREETKVESISSAEPKLSRTPSQDFYATSTPPRTPVIHSKALDDYSSAKVAKITTDGQWGEEAEKDEEEDFAGGERLPPEGENSNDVNDKTHVKVNEAETIILSASKVKKAPDSTKEEDHSEENSEENPLKNKLNEIYHSLTKGEVTVDQLTVDDIKDIVGDWQTMRKEMHKEREALNKEILHAKEELRKAVEEKDKMRKEKDRYVFKEFELQQKYQGLTDKHRTLRDEHEVLRQGNQQHQQSTKKNTKISNDLRKKIARLENKLKSMDKLTAKKSTQTQEVYEKDVYEAKRVAEESLSVVQSELREAAAKLKTVQQENEDLKKLINAKGREINKRERKSRKDEENIRQVSRERDSLETKLKKVLEQLEYYRGMLDIRTKGSKRPPEKKEVRVQRCSSGRHILVKTANGTLAHDEHPAADEVRKSTSGVSNAKPVRPGAATIRGQTNKKPYVNSASNSDKNTPKTENSSGGQIPLQGILKSSNNKPKESTTKPSEGSKQSSIQKPKSDNTNGTNTSQKSKVTIQESSDKGDKNQNKQTTNQSPKKTPSNIDETKTAPNGNVKSALISHATARPKVTTEEPKAKPRPVVMASSIKR